MAGLSHKSKPPRPGIPVMSFPVTIKEYFDEADLYTSVTNAISTEEQLAALKDITTEYNSERKDFIKFLVLTYLYADNKHPIKRFLTQYITKHKNLQSQFSETLALQIKLMIETIGSSPDHKQYADIVTKVIGCTENFPIGMCALKKAEIIVLDCLCNALQCCLEELRSNNLSPSAENEVFNVCHLSLRAALCTVQEVDTDSTPQDLTEKLSNLKRSTINLLYMDTLPMDSKSVCGILYVHIYILENGANSWINILDATPKCKELSSLVSDQGTVLSLYTGVVTVLPLQKLYDTQLDGHSVLYRLSKNIIDYSEKNASDSLTILTVSRSLAQITKIFQEIDEITESRLLVQLYLEFVGVHLEYHMDSVRHLMMQILNTLIRYAAKLQDKGDNSTLNILLNAITSLSTTKRKVYFVSITAMAQEIGATCVFEKVPDLVDQLTNALNVDFLQATVTTTMEVVIQRHIKETDTPVIFDKWITPILSHVVNTNVDSTVINICENILVKATKWNPGIIDLFQLSGLSLVDTATVSPSSAATGLSSVLFKMENWQKVATLQDIKAVKVCMNIRRSACSLCILQTMGTALPQIKATTNSNKRNSQCYDLKCILLILNVIRKSGAKGVLQNIEETDLWKGLVSYDILLDASVDALEETRLLSLSLIVDTPKSTEQFTKWEFEMVLYFLKYNINTQSPNFRQQMLALLKKLIKRIEDSFGVVKRERDSNMSSVTEKDYLNFLEELRDLCFQSLIPGVNYSRKLVALQILAWTPQLKLDDHEWSWSEDYADKLFYHLDDSYETTKLLSLNVLEQCCPKFYKARNNTSAQIKNILRQASSVKPTDCLSAAYKLEFLKRKLLDLVCYGQIQFACDLRVERQQRGIPECVNYHLLRLLLGKLVTEVDLATTSILVAAARAPMYGLLHCICHLLKDIDYKATAQSTEWNELIKNLIELSIDIIDIVTPVVNNSSPEGHLPMDFEPGCGHIDEDSLEDRSKVTAQMVLLCAWRSVKEISLLLGDISSYFTIQNEVSPVGNVTENQLMCIGEVFMNLLTETKHRGAFEQAYVGFSKLVTRLWRSPLASLHSVPASWLNMLMKRIQERGTFCGTRRGAGLPFIIQAIVTSEVQVTSNPVHFNQCMKTLLELTSDTFVDSRVHSLNILRALFRHAPLAASVLRFVAVGVEAAVCGFHGNTWAERNSSTLLLSALMVRVFGVPRHRENLSSRNKMTGRIFFLRYPQLYEFMMEKLIGDNVGVSGGASLPVLLILARLYPSALEGSVTNFKLVSYVPLVLKCAESPVLKTRQLAAKAIVPLISPPEYIPHLECMFDILSERSVKTNYCHGILLQIRELLQAMPDGVASLGDVEEKFTCHLTKTSWILEQSVTDRPCYLIADEYIKIVKLIMLRFFIIKEDYIEKLQLYLNILLFDDKLIPLFGIDVCHTNAFPLYIFLMSKYRDEKTVEYLIEGLNHKSYSVILAALNCILNLHQESTSDDTGCQLTQNRIKYLNQLKNDSTYINCLSNIFLKINYKECVQKSLLLLSLEEKEMEIVKIKYEVEEVTNIEVVLKLIHCIENEEDLTNIYLKSLLNFVCRNINDILQDGHMIDVLRVMYDHSTADRDDESRMVVADFLEKNGAQLVNLKRVRLVTAQLFEYTATLWATIVVLLEDDCADIRQRVANTVINLSDANKNGTNEAVVPSRAADILRESLQLYKDAEFCSALYLLLALLDFKAEVCTVDELSEECRVFDQNEKHNIFLEESVWSVQCLEKINLIHCNLGKWELISYIRKLLDNSVYVDSYKKLCKENYRYFKHLFDVGNVGHAYINPKIDLIYNMLTVTIYPWFTAETVFNSEIMN